MRRLLAAYVCLLIEVAAFLRGLALLEGLGVVSASHDQMLKVWTFEGECIATLYGHTALVYRCSYLHSAYLCFAPCEPHQRLSVQIKSIVAATARFIQSHGAP